MISELKTIDVEHLSLFKNAFSRGNRKGWVHYFPLLYFYSQNKNRDLLFYEDSGSLCLFMHTKNRLSSSDGRLALYFPPIPMNESVLKNALNFISDHNKAYNSRIIWIDEDYAKRIAEVKGVGLDVTFKEEEYLYDPKLYREMAGKKFSRMRNDFNHLYRIYNIKTVPYDFSYRDECLALLEQWEKQQGGKYNSIEDRLYTRACLKLADAFKEPDLIGRVILVDDQVKSFGFIGEMNDRFSSNFIVKSDHSYPGLNNLLWKILFMEVEASDYVNGSCDMGHPGLKFAKLQLRPVDMLKMYNARQVKVVSSTVKNARQTPSSPDGIDKRQKDVHEGPVGASRKQIEILEGLKLLSLEDKESFDRFLLPLEKRSWLYFYPFLYSFSKSRGHALYWEHYNGSLCIYALSESKPESPLSLYMTPFPFSRVALVHAMSKVERYNQNPVGEILWIEEAEYEMVSRLGYAIRPVEEEYIYSKSSLEGLYDSFESSENSTFRAYSREDEKRCMEILENWRGDFREKGGKATGYYLKKGCISNALKFGQDTLKGEVVLVDGTVQGVCFSGRINATYASFFATITDPEYRRLKLRQMAHVARTSSQQFYNNSAEKDGESEPFLSDAVKPALKNRLFRATKVEKIEKTGEWETKDLNTALFIRAAKNLGLGADIVSSTYSYGVITDGKKELHIYHNTTSITDMATRRVTHNKYLSQNILRFHQIPVPGSKIFEHDEVDKIVEYVRRSKPIVIKPIKGSRSVGVTIDPQDEEQTREAVALIKNGKVMIEQLISGDDYRILMYKGTIIDVLKWVPPYVVGNSLDTLCELIERKNQYISQNGLHTIQIDPEHIASQEIGMEDVLDAGKKVFLNTSNEHFMGGEAIRVDIEAIHPTNKEMFLKTAVVSGLSLAGLDFMSDDIGIPFDENKAGINEINSAPHIWPHFFAEQKEDISSVETILKLYFAMN